jgi:hypothetical protein
MKRTELITSDREAQVRRGVLLICRGVAKSHAEQPLDTGAVYVGAWHCHAHANGTKERWNKAIAERTAASSRGEHSVNTRGVSDAGANGTKERWNKAIAERTAASSRGEHSADTRGVSDAGANGALIK